MENLFSILQQSSAKVTLEVSGEDLLHFSYELITRTKEEFQSARLSEPKEEKYLTKEEVQTIFGVCSATLWHWNKKGFLKCVKFGRRVLYRHTDIQKILNGNDIKAQ